jgi:hypothetical protein
MAASRLAQRLGAAADSARATETLIALLVVPHGLTDLWALPLRPVLAAYACCGLACALCPAPWLPAVGLAASVTHFAGDLGWGGGAAVVAWCVGCHARQRDPLAYWLLLGYMLGVHLPAHYGRVAAHTPPAGWLALGALGAGSLWLGPLRLLQRSEPCRRAAVALVAAHTLVNLR